MGVGIEFDNEKDAVNQAKHGLPLSFAALLFEGDYKEMPDDRHNYGEKRVMAVDPIMGRLCVCIYTWRQSIRRIISLRKANRRENDVYNQD